MALDAAIAIFLITLVYVSITLFLNKKWGGRDRIKEIQAFMKEYQDEYAAAVKSNDEAALKRLQAREKEVNGMMGEMFILPLRSMVIVLPVFFLFIGTNGFLGIHFTGLVQTYYPYYSIILPFNIHLNAVLSWSFVGNILNSATYGPRGYFIVCAIFWGMALEAIVSRYIDPKKKPA